MKKCLNCNITINTNESICPKCGSKLSEDNNEDFNTKTSNDIYENHIEKIIQTLRNIEGTNQKLDEEQERKFQQSLLRLLEMLKDEKRLEENENIKKIIQLLVNLSANETLGKIYSKLGEIEENKKNYVYAKLLYKTAAEYDPKNKFYLNKITELDKKIIEQFNTVINKYVINDNKVIKQKVDLQKENKIITQKVSLQNNKKNFKNIFLFLIISISIIIIITLSILNRKAYLTIIFDKNQVKEIKIDGLIYDGDEIKLKKGEHKIDVVAKEEYNDTSFTVFLAGGETKTINLYLNRKDKMIILYYTHQVKEIFINGSKYFNYNIKTGEIIKIEVIAKEGFNDTFFFYTKKKTVDTLIINLTQKIDTINNENNY